MKIALDFDGVLAHTMKRWCEVCNGLSNKAPLVGVRDIEHWHFYKDFGLTKVEAFDIFDIVWQNWQKLEPMEPDLGQKTHMLNNLGQVDIVTSIHADKVLFIRQWLARHKIEFKELIFSEDKYNLDYDVFIDDSPENVTKAYENHKQCLLYNQPWNRDVPNKIGSVIGIRRVYNLYHAIDAIRELTIDRDRKK